MTDAPAPLAAELAAAPSAAPGLSPLDLQTVLAAWGEAAERLRGTHEALRYEVMRLTDELEAKNRELEHGRRLADLGRAASHVAHEVRNSLVPTTLYLSLLRRRLGADDSARGLVDQVAAGLAAVEAAVHDLLQFAADRPPARRPTPLRPLLAEVAAGLAPQCEAQGVRVHIEASADLTAAVDPELLRRAILNLTLNALDAMPAGGELRLAAESPADAADDVEILVADSGPGVPCDVRPRIFEPFFTTKSGGVGLGLAIVQRIAQAHGGEARLADDPAGGATFVLRFPGAALPAAAGPPTHGSRDQERRAA